MTKANTTSKKRNIETDLLSRILGIPAVALLVPLLYQTELGVPYWNHVLVAFIYTFVYWQGNAFIVNKLRYAYPEYKQTGKRLLFEVLAILAYNFMVAMLLTYITYEILGKPLNLEAYRRNFISGSSISLFITSIYESYYFFQQWKYSLVQAEKTKRAELRSRYENLKGQVNPHFLFNALNTLMAMIPEYPEKATLYTEKLAGLYRYALKQPKDGLVFLAEELHFAAAFFYLNQVRFEKALKWEVAIENSLLDTHKIPVFALQSLVENAIKHNFFNEKRPLTVQVFTQEEAGETFICVQNNKQFKTQLREGGSGLGLKNMRERFELIGTSAIRIEDKKRTFQVCLPLLKNI